MKNEAKIRRGDVLLFHGTDFISWGIRIFDGTDVNHAAIALDENILLEAAARGLRQATIEAAVSGSRYVRVRRHREDDLASVIATATSHAKRRAPYAYQQLVMLALLAATRNIPLGGTGRRMVRSILDHAMAALNAFVDRDGTQSMICSEFVYRAFAEAPSDPAERFRLLIQSGDIAFGEVEPCLATWALQLNDGTYEAAFQIPVSFDLAPGQPDETGEAAEEELAPIMAAWAEEHNLVTDDMPPLQPTFNAEELEEPTDEELLASLVSFSTAFTGETEFGIGTTLGVAAARGAIQGLLRPAIEANFVTPGDLLKSPTLVDIGRIDGLG